MCRSEGTMPNLVGMKAGGLLTGDSERHIGTVSISIFTISHTAQNRYRVECMNAFPTNISANNNSPARLFISKNHAFNRETEECVV